MNATSAPRGTTFVVTDDLADGRSHSERAPLVAWDDDGEPLVRNERTGTLQRALADEIAPRRDPSAAWTLADGGYPAEPVDLADALDDLDSYAVDTTP